MKTAHQLTFSSYEAFPKLLNPNDPIKIIFDYTKWFFIHPWSGENTGFRPKGKGYDLVSLFNAQFPIYLGKVGFDRKLASVLRYNCQTTVLKVIQGADSTVDTTHLWAYSSEFGKKTCPSKREYHHSRGYSDPDAH